MSGGMGGGATQNARDSHRVSAHWRARVLISAESFIEGHTVNVSEGGVSLMLERRFPDGASLTVALAIPDHVDRTRLKPVTLQARVVFHVAAGDRFRHGLQFTQISDEARQAIRRWVHLLMV